MLALTFAEYPPVDPRILNEILSLCINALFRLNALQAVIELGRGDSVALAKRVHETFKAFDSRTEGKNGYCKIEALRHYDSGKTLSFSYRLAQLKA